MMPICLTFAEDVHARLIAGTDKSSAMPFFSPDGQWLGYFSQFEQKLKKVAVSGGAPVVICDGLLTGAASWNSDNTIVYTDISKGIMRVSANGGTPENLIKGSLAGIAKEGFPILPRMLPDGKTLLFTNCDSDTGGRPPGPPRHFSAFRYVVFQQKRIYSCLLMGKGDPGPD